MLASLRRNPQFFSFFNLLYGIVAVLVVYYAPDKHYIQSSIFRSPFIQGWYHQVVSLPGWGGLFLVLILAVLILSAFSLTRLVVNHQLVSSRSQFTAICFLSIASLALRTELYSGALLAGLFVIFVLERIIGAIDQRGNSFRFLDAGALLAMGSLFYFNIIFLLPFLWLSQLILRPPSGRELAFTLIGIFVPAIYLVAGAYVMNIPIRDSWQAMKGWILLGKVYQFDHGLLLAAGYYTLVLIIASLFALNKFATSKIQVRKLLQVLFILFLNILMIGMFIPSIGNEILFLLAVPVSVLFSVYFTECRTSIWNRLFFILILVVPLAINFF